MPSTEPAARAATVETRIDAPLWRAIDAPEAFAQRAATAALEAADAADLGAEISILLTDDVRIAALNRAFRGRDAPTNVLSWPSVAWSGPASRADIAALGPTPVLGDVAASIETLQREAEIFGRVLEHHAAHLIVHGILHLLGYDHGDEESTGRMETVEDDALRRIGYAGRDA